MSDIQVPPLTRPTAEQVVVWEDWSDRELLIAQVIRVNYIVALVRDMSQNLPKFMGGPMGKLMTKMLIKADKTNE